MQTATRTVQNYEQILNFFVDKIYKIKFFTDCLVLVIFLSETYLFATCNVSEQQLLCNVNISNTVTYKTTVHNYDVINK